MSTAELKNKLLKRLEKVEEVYLLEEIMGMLDNESKDGVVKIPEHYKVKLEKSIAQKQAGNTISNNEVEKSIEGWLYK